VTTLAPRRELTLRASLVWSALLHSLVVAAVLFGRSHEPVAAPPMYRVTLIAAPAGPRQVGVVRETPPEPVPTPAPPAPAPVARATPEAGRRKAPPSEARPGRTA
jgi:hypothetical protein